MDESFYVIPSVASPSMKALQSENATLKLELQSTKTKLGHAEKAIKIRQEQERVLRDSIISVRREVTASFFWESSLMSFQAHRAMSSSAVGGRQASLAALESTFPIFSQALPEGSPQITPAPHALEREAQYMRRIRDLEEEIRLSRVENEKNVLIFAFRLPCCFKTDHPAARNHTTFPRTLGKAKRVCKEETKPKGCRKCQG